MRSFFYCGSNDTYFSRMASVASAYHPYERPAKAPKDPNKPKKKKSAFDIFRSEQMQEFKRLNPDTKVDLGG